MNVFEQERKGIPFNNSDSLEWVNGANKVEIEAVNNNTSEAGGIVSYLASPAVIEELKTNYLEEVNKQQKYWETHNGCGEWKNFDPQKMWDWIEANILASR